MKSPDIAIYGADGVVGRRIAGRLPSARALSRGKLELAGARVVIDAAGPLAESAAEVLRAAVAAGAHYIDVGGEQHVLHALHERHESAVRRAGLVALPGMGVDCALGDLAAAWAAAHLCNAPLTGPLVRGEPGERIADDRPLDDIAISYVYDDLALSAGSQRALFQLERPLAWRRDRWEPASGAHRVNAGAPSGYERDAIAFGGGDAITIPRHIAAESVSTYVSATRNAAASGALRLLSRALPLLPKAASGLLAPYATAEADLARTRFAVVAQVRRGFSAAQVTVRGTDLYETTAAIAAWAARQLAARGPGPTGMRAPSELFRPDLALHALADEAGLSIEPSFG